MTNLYTYLALGDSYTIGEAVPFEKNFPNQTVQLLRNQGINFSPAEIVAKTGWTTDELLSAIGRQKFLPAYDFVSLLIGVNNQYRGLSIKTYEKELEQLLLRAIAFAGGKSTHVAVLSIPDYGQTPYAQAMDPDKIAKEIDEFNNLNKELAFRYKLHYIDITQGTREAKNNPKLIAPDGLHPSEIHYAQWAKKLSGTIFKALNL